MQQLTLLIARQASIGSTKYDSEALAGNKEINQRIRYFKSIKSEKAIITGWLQRSTWLDVALYFVVYCLLFTNLMDENVAKSLKVRN